MLMSALSRSIGQWRSETLPSQKITASSNRGNRAELGFGHDRAEIGVVLI